MLSVSAYGVTLLHRARIYLEHIKLEKNCMITEKKNQLVVRMTYMFSVVFFSILKIYIFHNNRALYLHIDSCLSEFYLKC